MATNQRSRNGSGAAARNGSGTAGSGSKVAVKKMSAKQREAQKRRKIIIFAVEVIIILVMAAVLYLVVSSTGESGTGYHYTLIDPEHAAIDPVVQAQKEEGGTMHGYRNIALFGVDAKNSSGLYKGNRSDTIMIASINMDTGDIKLVSIYRDSYLNLGNDDYRKCNAAYANGGAEQAVKMLNMNLDMDITDFITVGYAALAEVIDGLGGVWIDVSEAELKHINNYQYSILGKWASKYITVSSDLNFTPDEYFADYDFKLVEKAGYQKLDGLQAAAYCRIRYAGNDFVRTERQREVLMAIEAEAKQANVNTLTSVFKSAADDIYTSLNPADILELLPMIADYRIADEDEFPGRDMRVTVNMGAKGSCEVPVDLETSVVNLHEFLFEDANYQVSETVREINSKLQSDTNYYRGN